MHLEQPKGRIRETVGELYMAFELGEKNWKLSLSDGARSPSHYTVTAGDTAAVLECISQGQGALRASRRRRACTAVMKPDATVSGSTAG